MRLERVFGGESEMSIDVWTVGRIGLDETAEDSKAAGSGSRSTTLCVEGTSSMLLEGSEDVGALAEGGTIQDSNAKGAFFLSGGELARGTFSS